jgi:YegS/Rv2252/BmrU family lipid kinase
MSESPRTPRNRRIVVIRNPVSGLPQRHSLVPRFLDSLKGTSAEVLVTDTEAAGHATELAREAGRRGCDIVTAIGGDGTLNETLNGMEDGGPALATFPTGTSSIIAKEIGAPFDPIAAARAIGEGRRRRLDVGRVNGRRFLIVVGVGWDAHVVNRVAATRTGHLGKHRYVIPVLAAVLDYPWPKIRVSVDGRPVPEPAYLAFAFNFAKYAAYFRIAPDAEPDDGHLDFITFRAGRMRDCPRWVWGAFTGTLPRLREVDYRKGRTLVVESDEPVPWQVDGDPGGVTPITVHLATETVEVIVP